MEFAALDVETANADLASVCQIGVAVVEAGTITRVWSTLVDPEEYFDEFNVAIHGITEQVVATSPPFPGALGRLDSIIGGRVIVSHTSFDRSAISLAAERYELSIPKWHWLDSARVVRRAWPERYSVRGYGLADVARDLGIPFKHHDASEDARAAAEIVLQAGRETGLDIQSWINRTRLPIDLEKSGARIERSGNPEGPLYGEILVFTGALELPRRKAADIAASAGCTVEERVTKKTTLLVVGDQDVGRLAGHEKSAKHRKAEALIGRGQQIRILRESDFKRLVADYS